MIWRREDRDDPRAQEATADVEIKQEDVQITETRKGVRRMAENGEVTIIGAGAKLDGTVVSAGSLRVDGQVKGSINADGDVTLAPQSQVDADIKAQNVSIAGRFKGNIVVKGRAELNRGGCIDGTVTSKTLVVEEGGIFQGQSIMDQQAAPQHQPSAAPAAPAKSSAPQAAQEAKV